ncbi:MAG: hypothetical protein Q9220_006605 [cf. Caloplaca sp. 1 TL-2023]
MRYRRFPTSCFWSHTSRNLSSRKISANQQGPSTEGTRLEDDDILPKHPTWSLRDLLQKSAQSTKTEAMTELIISENELHHLLRLSALPLPKDSAEQQRMQRDLQSQLRFVRAIQEVDIKDDVQPLQSIRDETEEAMKEREFTLDSLADEIAREEVVGKRGRIRARKGVEAVKAKEAEVDPLALAPRTVGRYIAVNTAKD